MNENTKTMIFVAAALAVLGIAWVAHPRSAFEKPLELAGEKLFTEFDPLDVTSLEVTRYDEATSTVRPFKVEQDSKRKWLIPSHENYPTDAKDQLAEAATSLTNLTIVGIESENSGDHEQFGVIDPTTKDLKPGTTGVGTRVTMKDKSDKPVVDLIIGKETPGSKGLRYVRRPGQDAVFTVKVATDKLSTDFGDWIEKDLLKLSTWDVKKIKINDYSVDPGNPDDPLKERGRMVLEYQDAGEPKWKLTEDKALQDGKATSLTMAADEELNAQKLDDMRNALGDLKIVDVRRKPAAVSANLKSKGTSKPDAPTASSLAKRGFYFANTPQGIDLLSAEGEARVENKDGVEYVLRFGNLTEATGGQSAKKEAGKDAKESSSSTARYLFVMAEFKQDAIPKPELKAVPPEAKPEAKPAEAKKEEAKKEEGKKEEAKKDPKAEREEIEKENKRKQDEYNDKVKKGQDKVKELNDRFADWYYVIDDSVYQKIHLGRKDVVKKKEAKKEGDAKSDGLKPPADSPAEFKGLMNELPAPKKEETSAAPKEPAAPAKPETPEAKKEVPPAPKADGKPAPKKDEPAAKAEPNKEAAPAGKQ